MSLVNVEDLTGYMGGITLTPLQEARVGNVILPGIQGELERHLNRKLEPVLMRESLLPDDRGYLVFTEAPVWEVMSVTRSSDGAAVPFPPPVIAQPVLTVPAKYDGIVQTVVDRAGLGMDAKSYMMPVAANGLLGFTGLDYISVMGYGALDGFYPEISFVCTYVAGYKGVDDPDLMLDILRVAAREVERMFDDTMSLRDATVGQTENSDSSWRGASKGWTVAELDSWNRLRRRVTK